MSTEKLININTYMEQKPYTIHTDYDIFYLKICRRLFSIINETADKYDNPASLFEEDFIDLALVLTAYFEDRVNEIGFWDSLIKQHQIYFGKRLPFFDNNLLKDQEEEFEDIIPADIHYLLYISYLNLLADEEGKSIVFLNTSFLVELTEKIFDYLNDIEEVVTTDYYESYLVPDTDYIDFKKKIDWFTFNGYLTGIEFSKKLDDHSFKLMEENTGESFMGPMMYAEVDRLLFEEPSSFTAIFPVDIFAGAMRCSNEKKQEISNLKFRATGIFHVQNETNTHYLFLHTSTGEEFNVLKNSFNIPFNSKEGEYWITTVAKWNDDCYVSGICLPSPYQGEEIYNHNLKLQHSYQKHFPEYRNHLEETALNDRNKGVEFFGDELIIFETGEHLQQKLNNFNQWYFDNVTDKSKLDVGSKPVLFHLPAELKNASFITLFIPPTDNFQFVTKHDQLLKLLQTETPENSTNDEMEEVFALLVDDSVGADYWYYLKKNYPLPNLGLFMKCPVEEKEDFDALLRIYRSEDFSPLKLPRFSTFTSERISGDTAMKIFSSTNG